MRSRTAAAVRREQVRGSPASCFVHTIMVTGRVCLQPPSEHSPQTAGVRGKTAGCFVHTIMVTGRVCLRPPSEHSPQTAGVRGKTTGCFAHAISHNNGDWRSLPQATCRAWPANCWSALSWPPQERQLPKVKFARQVLANKSLLVHIGQVSSYCA